jgi:hypothetical protein
MAEPSLGECFRLLGLKRRSDFGTVKQAYRKILNTCHPDRFQNRPDLLPTAEQKAKRVIQAYGILEKWYESNGGTDPGPANGVSDDSTPIEEPYFGMEEEQPFGLLRFYRPWMKFAGAGVLFGMLIATWEAYFSPDAAPVAKAVPEVHAPSAMPSVHEPAPSQVQSAAPSVKAGPASPKAANLDALRAAVKARTEELKAVGDARDQNRDAWAKGYLKELEAGRAAAEAELSSARAQYKADVLDAAPAIADAEREEAKQKGLLQERSDAARLAFENQQANEAIALRSAYEQWLVDRGRDAVALIHAIHTRDNEVFSVFSNTEDPSKIFEFWTPKEAGSPEINIAAKTGVTVLQPNDRYFPHFRTNIFLYDAEGKQLVAMMESVIGRHDALEATLAEQRRTRDEILSHWDESHPLSAVTLPDAMAAVLARRDQAVERLSRAQAREEDARRTQESPSIESAYGQSGKGREWENRYLAAMAALSEATQSLAEAEHPRRPGDPIGPRRHRGGIRCRPATRRRPKHPQP